MVKSFEPGRGQAAFWACPRLVIYLDSSGLNTAYENEGAPPLEPARGWEDVPFLVFASH